MPYYNYICHDCQATATSIKGAPLTEDELGEVLLETRHAMSPSPEELAAATECPRCSGHNVQLTIQYNNIHSYTRGYGYLDRAGCHRDMNLHKLTTDDPYGYMREPGEADDLKLRLARAGKTSSTPKHIFPS